MAHDEPAFPVKFGPDDRSLAVEAYPGMTLRDWFAGQALMAVVTVATMPGAGKDGGGAINERDLAEVAYAFADALLAARKKAPTP